MIFFPKSGGTVLRSFFAGLQGRRNFPEKPSTYCPFTNLPAPLDLIVEKSLEGTRKKERPSSRLTLFLVPCIIMHIGGGIAVVGQQLFLKRDLFARIKEIGFLIMTMCGKLS